MMRFRNSQCLWRFICPPVLFCVSLSASVARAQGPAPESAPSLFPGGVVLSYNSTFTKRGPVPNVNSIPISARPLFSHEGDFVIKWGFRRNFDVTLLLPIVTNHFQTSAIAARNPFGGTGLGDVMLSLKYRFYRRDSPRGTTQASLRFGPKLPSGISTLADANGQRLPAGLQPGSGSTDLFLGAAWTYTGLFNRKRWVADEDFRCLVRTEGTQATRLGSSLESRFWLSDRPYQSSDVGREWFIGPAITWKHVAQDHVAGITQKGTGGDALLVGVTNFVGLRSGMHVWFGIDWVVAHSNATSFLPVRRHISFGITRQFQVQR